MSDDQQAPNDNSKDVNDQTVQKAVKPPRRNISQRLQTLFAVIIVSSLIIVMSFYGYTYISTPVNVRQPLYEHYHFRLSLNVDSREVNFADAKFQEGYSKDNCNADLPTHPFHFHDDRNHFVHVHWEGMTGGQLLKYYGWNYIGGTPSILGYRFDQQLVPQRQPIHGNVLPHPASADNFYVYSGSAARYRQRDFKDFTSQDLEKFFGRTSNSPSHTMNKQKRGGLASWLEPKAYAHDHEAAAPTVSLSRDQLLQLNNLIGDVVIFVQKTKPTDSQIKDRFDHLTPLSTSTCAG
jgi:hypothetical protein